MRRILSIFTVFVCFCSLALATGAPPVAAQAYGVVSPSSRTAVTAAQYGAPVTLSGWVLTPGQTVTIAAIDQNTGTMQSIGSIPASTSGTTYRVNGVPRYTLYPWSYTTTGPLAANYWAPQLSFAAGVPTSQGHLELFASAGGATLPTFSAAALSALQQSPEYPIDPYAIGPQFSDGDSTVLFDQYGVGGAAASWMTITGTLLTPPPPPSPVCPTPPTPPTPPCNSPYPSVAWGVGSYTDGAANTTIYAMVCAPNKAGNYPLVVYNHGGINYGSNSTLGDIGSLYGNLTSAGWTSQPPPIPPPPGSPPGTQPTPVTDHLGQCVDWAKRGWIFAMSSYRAESIYITMDNQPYRTWSSGSTKADGSSEFCMGEVTDVMALVDILVNRIGTISLGNPNNPIAITTSWNPSNPTIAWNGELFMYGYSHGGCITYRAVEQGAPVKAFAVIEGFTDLSLGYLNVLAACYELQQSDPNAKACYGPGPGGTMVFDPTGWAAGGSGAVDTTGTVPYYPDASGVMGYNWRSAHYFASRGDLGIRKFQTMPILILHGDDDIGNPVPLDEPAEFAPDISATDIYYGPNICVPSGEPCIPPTIAVGAPIVDPMTHLPPSGWLPPSGALPSCAVSFTTALSVGVGDPCLGQNGAAGYGPCVGGTNVTNFGSASCKVIALPLTPQQQHNLVVYHNMDHVNGGLAIKNQLDRFVEQNFGRKPGCDGVPTSTGPIACNGYY
jgi:hypothetical protein